MQRKWYGRGEVAWKKAHHNVQSIPLTKTALKEHVKRAVHQGGCGWGQLLVSTPEWHSPCKWGWSTISGLDMPLANTRRLVLDSASTKKKKKKPLGKSGNCPGPTSQQGPAEGQEIWHKPHIFQIRSVKVQWEVIISNSLEEPREPNSHTVKNY